MATDLQTPPGPSATTLVSGIIKDSEDLIKQEIALIKHEFKDDLRKTKEAASVFMLGSVTILVGVVLLTFMLVHLLFWADTGLPLWACYGIVGAVVTALGGALIYWGKKDIDEVNPLDDQAAKALKETMQWKTNPIRK